jgi:hypothetical protein
MMRSAKPFLTVLPSVKTEGTYGHGMSVFDCQSRVI